jgi:hypothetical protein
LPSLAIVGATDQATVTVPHPLDLNDVVGAVREAAIQHDVVLASVHAHEREGDSAIPATFLRVAARHLVEAGAAAVICHGPHTVSGIELCGSAPIFYSLGNLFFEVEHIAALPPDSYAEVGLRCGAPLNEYLRERTSLGVVDFFTDDRYWTSVVAVITLDASTVTDVQIQPIELGLERTDGSRGRPRLARGSLAKAIIEHVREQSEPFGTVIRGDEVGHLVLQ